MPNINPNKTYLSEVTFSAKHLVTYVGVFALLCGIYIYSSMALNPNLPGDVNGDNIVDSLDLSLLLKNYDSTTYKDADFDNSGKVDVPDLSVLLTNYNRTYTPTPPPPPSTNTYLNSGVAAYNLTDGVFTDSSKLGATSLLIIAPHQQANKTAFKNYWAGKSTRARIIPYKIVSEVVAANGASTWDAVQATQTVNATTRMNHYTTIPAEEVKWHDQNVPNDQWMLYSSNGTPLTYQGFTKAFMADAGNPNFQARSLAYLREQITAQGYDGVFFDNVLVSSGTTPTSWPYYIKNAQGQLVVKYADKNAWSNAVESYMNNVAKVLKNEGKYVVGNTWWFVSGEAGSNDGTSAQAWWRRVAPTMNALMAEYSAITPQGYHRSTNNNSWDDYWLGFTKGLYDAAKSAGSAMLFGSTSVEADIRYVLGTQRVLWDGSAYGYTSIHTGDNYWSPYFNIDFGTPVGSMMQNGQIYARRWSKQWVVVNTSESTQTVTFTDPTNNQPRTFTVNAVDAYIGQ